MLTAEEKENRDNELLCDIPNETIIKHLICVLCPLDDYIGIHTNFEGEEFYVLITGVPS